MPDEMEPRNAMGTRGPSIHGVLRGDFDECVFGERRSVRIDRPVRTAATA
jgi:hypothetical protein